MNRTLHNTLTSKILTATAGAILFGMAIIGVAQLIPVQQVFAQQSTTKPLNDDAGGFVPCGNTADNPCQIGHLFSTFVVIINYLIAMAGFVAVVAIVYAGFMMVYSQGQDQLKAAKGRLSGAIIGLVLVAAAFVLINAIFSGSLSLGVRQGGNILSDPLEYIKNGPQGAGGTSSTPTPAPATNSTPKPNTNTNTTPPKPGK